MKYTYYHPQLEAYKTFKNHARYTQPLGEWIELVVYFNDKPVVNPATHKLVENWQVDLIENTYTQVWIEIALTEQEQIDYINGQALQAEENRKEIARQRLANAEVEVINAEVVEMDDETALENPTMFPAYAINKSYIANERFYYPLDDKLYKVLQNHTSALEWKPNEAVSLYVAVTPPGQIDPWVQPQGAHDAYQIGDKVTHNGQTWICTVANNTWEPGVYGWEVFTG